MGRSVLLLLCCSIAIVFLSQQIAANFPGRYDMFKRFPQNGQAHLPDLNVTKPVPFYNYDSDALLIHGWVSPSGVVAALKNKNAPFYPVVNSRNNRAFASFWIVDYKNTTCGPYKELVVTYVVADEPTVVDCHSIHCFNVITSQPGIRQYVEIMLLSEDLPIEYGRRLLGTDKYKAEIQIDRKGDSMSFNFVDSKEKDVVLKGNLELNPGIFSGYFMHIPYLIADMGLLKSIFFITNPPEFIRYEATGPPGIANAEVVPKESAPLWGALFVTNPRFAWYEPSHDLELGSRWASLEFEPVLYQFDKNLMAILLNAWGHAMPLAK